MLFKNNENEDNTLNEDNKAQQKQQTLIEKDQQSNYKYPDWDILPPFQFINPRIKKMD